MNDKNNRRKYKRQALDPPELGYLLTESPGYKQGTTIIDPPVTLYVDVLNKSQVGAALKMPRPIEPETAVSLSTYNDDEKLWYVSQGEVKWVEKASDPFNNFLVGLEISKQEKTNGKISPAVECPGLPDPSVFQFFNQTDLFGSIPREALSSLLNSLTYREIKSGDRFIKQGDPLDQRSDIYALGITTYEMLTGQRPFPEDDFMALLNMHLDEDIPDPALIRPDIPDALRQFVLKACARKCDQRYQTVDQVLDILLPLAGEMGLTPNLPSKNKRGLTTLHLIYEDEQRLALKHLLEDFNAKARKIGVELKAAEFPEI